MSDDSRGPRAGGTILPVSDSNNIVQLLRCYLPLPPTLMISRVLRVVLSIFLLPFNNAILIAACIWRAISRHLDYPSPSYQRHQALRDVHFYPKTVLITGLGTPHGLAIARAWYAQGHRVIGAEVCEHPPRIPSSEGLSISVAAFYHVPRAHYVARLLDIIQREKVDIWIPSSPQTSFTDDAVAKQMIEGRTSCACITLDCSFAHRFSSQDAFIAYLRDKDLPVVESHYVNSRDSIHKILHRSPTKVFAMQRGSLSKHSTNPIVLPRRTLSLTYSQVSEIQISKEDPWVMQQQTRVGEFTAETLIVSGEVKALRVQATGTTHTRWGRSRLDEGLAMGVQRLVEQFASKGGVQMTGHLSIQLMVDEEFDANNVRYVIHIAGCTPGAGATEDLLVAAEPRTLIKGYLSSLSPQVNGVTSICRESLRQTQTQTQTIIATAPRQTFSLYRAVRGSGIRRVLPAFYPTMQKLDKVIVGVCELLFFWNDWRFSSFDPLPWWWHTHVYQPLEDVELVWEELRRPKAKSW